jgi:hypothetical protein
MNLMDRRDIRSQQPLGRTWGLQLKFPEPIIGPAHWQNLAQTQ